ncbi:hypothetical protein ACX80E_16190 [Arthrobacter sp. TMN-49]
MAQWLAHTEIYAVPHFRAGPETLGVPDVTATLETIRGNWTL